MGGGERSAQRAKKEEGPGRKGIDEGIKFRTNSYKRIPLEKTQKGWGTPVSN